MRVASSEQRVAIDSGGVKHSKSKTKLSSEAEAAIDKDLESNRVGILNITV
jgi:hypothetical protein